jgi:hypothetical protein
MNSGEPRMPQDEDVRQAWRAAATDSPPAHLDAAILAAARAAVRGSAQRSVAAPKARPWYREWQPMLAAAAVAGLAFLVIEALPRGEREALPSGPSAAKDEPPPVTNDTFHQQPPSAVTAEARADAKKAAGPPAGSSREASTDAVKPAASAEPRPAAPPAAVTPAPEAADSLMTASPPATANRERAAGSMDQEGIDSSPQAGAMQQAVAARIDHIVTLYRAGDESAAATELRALRADVEGVDAQLPANLRAWARTVR